MKKIILITNLFIISSLCLSPNLTMSKDQKTIKWSGLNPKLVKAIKKAYKKTYRADKCKCSNRNMVSLKKITI